MINRAQNYWNPKDCDRCLFLSEDQLTVAIAHGKGTVRAKYLVPRDGNYYFEVKIVRGRNVCVGISSHFMPMNLHLGDCAHSYGYNNFGNFGHSGARHQYGPTFGAGDVVGCGIRAENREIYFTKNGRYLGKAAATLPSGIWHNLISFSYGTMDLFPTVTLAGDGDQISANFGQNHFEYDF